MSLFSQIRKIRSWFAVIAVMLCGCAITHGQTFSDHSIGEAVNSDGVGGERHAHDFSASTDGQPSASHHAAIPTTWPARHANFDSQIQTAVLEQFDPHPSTPKQLETATDQSSTGGMLESWIDQAGPAIAGVGETLNQTTGGWLGKITSKFSGRLSGGNGKLDVSRMLASLALVVGCYFAFVWLMRKMSPGGNRGLPAEVVQVLGKMPFGLKENLQLVRLGNKLVLLLTSLEHTQPIGEITDPQEVEYFTSLCQSGKQGRGAIASAVSRSLTGRLETTAPATVNSPAAITPPSPNIAPPAAASFQTNQPVVNSSSLGNFDNAGNAGNAGLINVLRSLENTIRSRPQSTQSTLYEA